MRDVTTLAIAAAIAVCGAAAAGAQTATSNTAANDTELETIVVTAQKRSEDIQKVPLSIQALSTEKLEQLHIANFNDYVKYSSLELVQYGVMEAVNDLCLTQSFEMVGLALHGLGYFDVALRRTGEGGGTGEVSMH